MNIGSITDTDHQPGGRSGALASPVQAKASRMNHGRIGSDINAVHTRNGINGT